MNKRLKGYFYEDVASEYLTKNGITILERNFTCPFGEIDIIGAYEDTLIFFEVKYRKDDLYGNAFDAVDLRKQKRIIKCAQYYLNHKNIDMYIRFDVIGVNKDKLDWIKNAFCV